MSCLFAFSASAHAQTTPPEAREQPGNDWSRVQAIAAGTLVHVKTVTHNASCRVVGAGPEQLRCEGGRNFGRGDVKRIALGRRSASAAAFGALGVGVGVATTAIVSKAWGYDGHAKGGVWAGAAGLGGLIFAPIGFFCDPFRGPVVYTAP